LSRIEAAAYVGVSPSLFDLMVQDSRMPGPKLINTRTVWDRFALDRAFKALKRTTKNSRDAARIPPVSQYSSRSSSSLFLRTAKMLGIAVPNSIQLLAGRLIADTYAGFRAT
jgi:hypothetical protein